MVSQGMYNQNGSLTTLWYDVSGLEFFKGRVVRSQTKARQCFLSSLENDKTVSPWLTIIIY